MYTEKKRLRNVFVFIFGKMMGDNFFTTSKIFIFLENTIKKKKAILSLAFLKILLYIPSDLLNTIQSKYLVKFWY